MRYAYREQLDNFAHDLIVMCDAVSAIMDKASTALLTAELQPAEEAISLSDELADIRMRCEERAVALLALENPLAKDLRQVVSSIYIVEELNRMGELAQHIAKAARRRHPEFVLPEAFRGYFKELARLVGDMAALTRDVLVDPDTDGALQLTTEDDAVDDINHHLLSILTEREWNDTARAAVDIALLSRFYERYADHCVNVAARVIFLITGLSPNEYLARQESESQRADVEARFAALERQFKH
ncbi:MAG: phosphate signaling complex protein PhoU [Corynebacterium sp.]|nr:phosphate signaling complex protein PhoU [Corynebacterium sp.]